ncbi:hypothetical protein BKA63DRAFT_429950 [Paraphoma chrysanthemicola]|nr:hypothetical protein BKA63DRAFT_429950 [Paraphoma chrysanthemicola]
MVLTPPATSPTEAPEIKPAPFPTDGRHDNDMEFVKIAVEKCRISAAVFRKLWDRNCIEVDNLPAADLANEIDPIFGYENFAGALTAADYSFIHPAIRLASRLINAPDYIEFWQVLTMGRAKRRAVQVRDGDVNEFYIRHPHAGTSDEGRTERRLRRIAGHIRWFFMDQEWTNAQILAGTVAETFMDADDRNCKRHCCLHNDNVCGRCKYCIADTRGRCAICGYCEYAVSWNCKELKSSAKERGITGYSKLRKAELIAALQANDGFPRTPAAQPGKPHIPETDFHNIQIGLIRDVRTHIKNRATDNWSKCQELRFQFALAATLVHEFSHAFWFFAQQRCWSCFKVDPWYYRGETRPEDTPELGQSWEYFAFGMRVPPGGRIRGTKGESPPHIFSQCHWNYAWATEEAGRSDTHFDVVNHDFILPVDYINSWFLESTWRNIETNGRDDSFSARTCSIEDYTYPELCGKGGFRGTDRAWIYGNEFRTKTQERTHWAKLRRECRDRTTGKMMAKTVSRSGKVTKKSIETISKKPDRRSTKRARGEGP